MGVSRSNGLRGPDYPWRKSRAVTRAARRHSVRTLACRGAFDGAPRIVKPRLMRRLVAATAFLLLATAARADFHVLRTAVVGGDGGWDYVRYDDGARRLFIARSTHVMVLDADSLTVVGDIPGTPGVHGVAFDAASGRGCTTNGRDTSVTIFDLKTLQPVARVKVGLRPDGLAWDPASRKVFVMNAGDGTASAVDLAAAKVTGTVVLHGQPEEAVADGAGRLYVNLEDSSAVVAIDTKSLAVVGRWSLAPGDGPSGIAFDRAHGRLFSVCDNKTMVVSDVKAGRVVTTLPIGGRVDGAAFDPERGLAFSSNGEGTVTVVHEDSPAAFHVVANVPTAMGARTIAYDPRGHRAFVVTAKFGTPPEPTPDQPRPRAPMVPGSFEVIVLGD